MLQGIGFLHDQGGKVNIEIQLQQIEGSYARLIWIYLNRLFWDTFYIQMCLIRNSFWCGSDSLLSEEISRLLVEVRPGQTSKLELTHQVNQNQFTKRRVPLLIVCWTVMWKKVEQLHSGPIRDILWMTPHVKWNYCHGEIKARANFSMSLALSGDWLCHNLNSITSASPWEYSECAVETPLRTCVKTPLQTQWERHSD